MFGIAFLIAVIGLVLFLERVFPSLYSYPRGRRWWQHGRVLEGIVTITLALIISILSSRIATLWFGLLLISAVLVALVLRVTRGDSEL
jgi:hypothetical protein